MQIRATVRYVCHTCGDFIVDEDNRPDNTDVVFLDSEGNVVEPPFPSDTTSHHAHHLEE